MKSLVEEASTVAKAIEKAWERAGKPEAFSVKIYETAEKGFLGFTTKRSAKVGIFFEEVIQPQRTSDRRPHANNARPSQHKPTNRPERSEQRSEQRTETSQRPTRHENNDRRPQGRPQQDSAYSRPERQQAQPRYERREEFTESNDNNTPVAHEESTQREYSRPERSSDRGDRRMDRRGGSSQRRPQQRRPYNQDRENVQQDAIVQPYAEAERNIPLSTEQHQAPTPHVEKVANERPTISGISTLQPQRKVLKVSSRRYSAAPKTDDKPENS